MKTIKVRQDKKTGECFLKLSDFEGFVDITKVKKYKLEPVDDSQVDKAGEETNVKALILTFYDENDQVVEAKS